MLNWLKKRGFDWKYLPHTGVYYLVQLSIWVTFYCAFVILDKPLQTDSFTISMVYSSDLLVFLLEAALIEELLFRFLVIIPVFVGWPVWTPIVVSIGLSAMYGYGSVDLPNQLINFLSAMIFCLQFLDMGVWQKNYVRAFVSCVIVNVALKVSKAFFLILLMEMS